MADPKNIIKICKEYANHLPFLKPFCHPKVIANIKKAIFEPPDKYEFIWDIPHTLERLLKRYAYKQKVSICSIDSKAACYKFSNGQNSSFKLNQIAVCPPPTTFNSGSHRLVFDAHFQGERFVFAVEEREGLGGTFEGEQIILGYYTLNGKKMVESYKNGKKNFAIDFVKSAIAAAVRTKPIIERKKMLPNYSPRYGKGKPINRDRFELALKSASAVLNNGCKLSPAAKGSLISIFY